MYVIQILEIFVVALDDSTEQVPLSMVAEEEGQRLSSGSASSHDGIEPLQQSDTMSSSDGMGTETTSKDMFLPLPRKSITSQHSVVDLSP